MKKQYPATDIVIFSIENEQLKVLLIKRENQPFKNYWALPGGFIHQNESPEKAALRVLDDKAGIKNVFIEQLYTFGGFGRDPRGSIITVAYFALVPESKINPVRSLARAKGASPKDLQGEDLSALGGGIAFGEATSNGIQTPTFYSIKKLPRLAFDHKKIIDYALKRLQTKLEYTNAVYSLLPNYFPFNELQKAYEAILGRKLDKRNFRKKFEFLGLIKPTKKVLTGNRQRPARLYQFVSRKPAELKKFF
ncbi:MAG: NUDIX domain-containing protein [Candidatus Taylorbacteria bacterium]|nr:NUDIX domain-containing protein [Candidatus Taylorbacteria bacterium]